MRRRWFPFTAKPPGPPDAKASRTAALFAVGGGVTRPRWTPADYAAIAREGYQRNPFVYRSVRMLADAVAAIPYVLTEGARELDRHPLLDLLARPNGRQGRGAFLETVASHLMVAGNAYLELVAPDGLPGELHALRPDRVRVVPGRDGWPAAFDYTVDGRSVRLPAEAAGGPAPVLHLSAFHPLDDHYGLAPLEPAMASLDVQNAASAWNKALLDNAARPSGALVYDGSIGLGDDQVERLRRELEDSYQGPRNAGRPLLLEGGLDWKPMALTPAEMDFAASRTMAAREIALAFGVPPMLLGIPGDATYANYQEANRAFWRQSVLPLAQRIADGLAGWLGPAFGADLVLALDLDQVSALHGEREALWERVRRAGVLTVNEKRAALGYGPLDGGDRLDAGEGGPASGIDAAAAPTGAEAGRWT
jgi:HK97 family phage portal protein